VHNYIIGNDWILAGKNAAIIRVVTTEQSGSQEMAKVSKFGGEKLVPYRFGLHYKKDQLSNRFLPPSSG